MFVMSIIFKFMHNLSRHHLGTAKRILRYARGTLDYSIRYAKVPNLKLISFTDSDWVDDVA